MSWRYLQSTGEFFRISEVMNTGQKITDLMAHGYSGFGAGKNNPAMQDVHDVGPIPVGEYEISAPEDTATHGPHVMRLTPMEGTNTFGRGQFLLHGDSVSHPGTASHGCIVLSRAARELISASGDTILEVA